MSSSSSELPPVTTTTEPKSELPTPKTDERMIQLQSSDGDITNITESAASLSEMLKNIIEDVSTASIVPVPNVTSQILSKVVDYCNAHSVSSKTEEELKAFDTEFVVVDQDTLFDILIAANYMDIKGLLDLCSETIADMMRGKTPEEIRKIFHIVNDYTQEEEDAVRKENAWAFE